MKKNIMDYNQYKFLSFDCYGTLIDWETGIWNAFQRIISLNNRTDLSREKVLSHFAELEGAQQTNAPSMLYPEVLYNVHRQFANRNKLNSNEELDKEFGNSVPYWPAFADSADALRKLKTKFKSFIPHNMKYQLQVIIKSFSIKYSIVSYWIHKNIFISNW